MASPFPEPSTRSVARLAPGGSIVSWLVHSKQDSARRSRRLLNTWLEPLDQDAGLLEKLFGDNRAFRAAFHQLYLAASFRQAQHAQDRHLPATSVMPLRAPGGIGGSGEGIHYLDAVTVESDPGPGQRLNTLLGQIESFDTPGFKVVVTAESIGPLPVTMDLLRLEITRWLAALRVTGSPRSEYENSYHLGGWSLRLEAIRINPHWWATPSRTTFSETAYAHQRADEVSLRCMLEAAAAHRQVQPCVLAAAERSFSPGLDHGRNQLMAWHRTNALFGTAGALVENPHHHPERRLSDGFWRPRSSAHRQVCAVLLTDHLAPWNALQANPELWINPATAHPGVLGLPLWRHIQFRWTDGEQPEVHHINASAVTAKQFWA